MASNRKQKTPKTTLKEGVDIILDFWDQQPGDHFCLPTKTVRGKWRDEFFNRDEFDDVYEFVKDNRDKNIYFCPHGFTKLKRLKDYAVPPHALYADLDEADPRTIKHKPTIAFESSQDRHVGMWVTDGAVTEELNQRMTMAVGADKSGWDFTQVLRFPGTINYKYDDEPTVEVMWEDGPTYTVEDLERKLPRVPASKKHSRIDIDPSGHESKTVLRKYSKKLSPQVKQLIQDKHAAEKDRSKCIFQIVAGLYEAGASPDEIAAVVGDNVYFIDKHGGHENRLEAEINRCLNKLDTQSQSKTSPFVNLADVDALKPDWLWKPFIPYGMISIIEGDPGETKTFLGNHISAQVSIGGKLPGTEKLDQGNVLYLTAEDDPAYTIRPRIDAMGGNPSKIRVQKDFLSLDEAGWKTLMDEIDNWQPALIVLDPLYAYVPPGQDMYKPNVIRALLSRLKDIAEKTRAAVVVIRHLTKMKHDKAIYQGGGSIDVIGAARSTIRVMKNPEDPNEKLVLQVKLNIEKFGRSWLYKLVEGRDGEVPTLEWIGPSDLTMHDVMAGTSSDQSSMLEDAVEFLRTQLKDGPKLTKLVEKNGEKYGYAKRTLDRARSELGVQSEKGKDGWMISLPPEK